MKKKLRFLKKTLAIVLILCSVIATLPIISSSAVENNLNDASQSTVIFDNAQNIDSLVSNGELTIEELQTATLSLEDTPEIVSRENIIEKQHVNRLWEQENDLNSIAFQNKDGSKTLYHYSSPVKYKDKNGKIKDKKNTISLTANGDYANLDNDINAYFPKKLHKNKGVELTFEEYCVEVSPDIKGNSGASRQTGHNKNNDPTQFVEYPNVFGQGISVRYTPTFEGYKEDIILYNPGDQSTFNFIVKTNGLSLIQINGSLYLCDPVTGEEKATFGNVYVYDSFDNGDIESVPHNTDNNEVTLQTVQENYQYNLTIIVDEAFLKDSETIYPVFVDPTLTVMEKGDVQNAAIYSNGVSFWNDNDQVKVGYASSYGTGRGLYNFPILNYTDPFIDMYGNQITSATMYLYALPYGSSMDNAKTLSLYEFYSEWSPSTVKWSNTSPSNYGNLISSTSVTSRWTGFDITHAILRFKNDSEYALAFKGLLLRAETETGATWKKFVSTQSTSYTNYRPYLEINYNNNPPSCSNIESGEVYFLKNYNNKYLDVYNADATDNTRVLTYQFHGLANQQFKIVNVANGEYEIIPQHTTGKVVSVDSSYQVIIEQDADLARQRWYIFYRNGNYHIVNKQYCDKQMEAIYSNDYVSVRDLYTNCCWEIINVNPLHPTNINFIRYTKIPSSQTTHLLCVVSSSLQSEHIFSVTNENNGASRNILITDSLKSELNNLEEDYHAHLIPITQSTVYEAAAHAAKAETDQLVTAGYITSNSSEYYGAWASNYAEELTIYNYWADIVNKASAAYGVYLAVSSFYYSTLASGVSTTVNSSQYVSISDQIDDIATQLTVNPSSNKVMLGTSANGVTWYEAGSQQGMCYFYTPNWNNYVSQYGDDLMISANKQFLFKQKAAGKQFWFSHDPMSTLNLYPNSSFAMELNWLKESYGLSQLTSANFIQSGSFWYFVP